MLPLPLVFPTFIGAAAFIRTLNPGGLASGLLAEIGIDATFELRGLFGAWLVLTLFTYPYVYLPVAARLRRLPGSLEESARVLGDSAPQAFRRIVMPQIAGSIAAGTLLVFLYAISDFGAVQLMRYDTLTRAIETNYLARPAVAQAMASAAPHPARSLFALCTLTPSVFGSWIALLGAMPFAASTPALATFTSGVILASVIWHLGLGTTAGVLGSRLTPGHRASMSRVGGVVMLGFALWTLT